jgi:hypothetical protein
MPCPSRVQSPDTSADNVSADDSILENDWRTPFIKEVLNGLLPDEIELVETIIANAANNNSMEILYIVCNEINNRIIVHEKIRNGEESTYFPYIPRFTRENIEKILEGWSIQAVFIRACQNNNIDVLNEIYDACGNAFVNQVFMDGPPIQHAIINDSFEAAEWLIEHGMDVNVVGVEHTFQTLNTLHPMDPMRAMIFNVIQENIKFDPNAEA